ncbi:MAG: leucyl/phenylalanyl-tRNA--protein transferase [Gammaproteobacteria bacterium SG8_11]|nr:MAG: leucyl/phenylalanyl-tRNA--protein transferase [Gammaproteobacteria bacterium SG8_11]
MAPFWIDPNDTTSCFPDVSLALEEPDGLLAIGGSLSPQRLISAYCHGIFPWYNEDQPILWWSPNPRAVLFPRKLHISRSLRKTLRKNDFTVTMDQTFDQVINACSEPRAQQQGTWISPEMKAAYCKMHELGHAHSVECWQNNTLVGGLYGLAFGKVFFGESMFSRVTDASKVAFVQFVRQLQSWGFLLIDCQVETEHLTSLGAELIPRVQFVQMLENLCYLPTRPAPWRFESNIENPQ